jgi:hypothetical protein
MTVIQRIRTVFTGVAGTPWYSNLYVTATEADAQAEVNIIDGFWEDIKAQMKSTVNWTVEGTVANIDDATGQIVGFSSNDSQTGSGADVGDALPYATQGLIRLRTGVFMGGREVRGRFNVPAPTENQSSDAKPNSGYLTDLQTAINDRLLGATGLNGALVVYSPTNATSVPVSEGSVAPFWAVLRSRRD